MKLNELSDNIGARKPRKRVGRGIGSGTGKTATAGHKGQKARGSGKVSPGFEGGQSPIYIRMPKRGFNNIFAKKIFAINLGQLQSFIDSGKIDPKETINLQYMVQQGIIKGNYDGVKILGEGALKASLNVDVYGVSNSARKVLEDLNSTINTVK